MTTLEPGYYWVQSTNPEYPQVIIAEWSEFGYWYDMGVDGHCDYDAYRVLSSQLAPPKGTHKAPDGTTRQSHYGSGEQPWDVIKRKGWGAAFAAGNILKYVRREKDGEQDLEKARWYHAELREIIRGPHSHPARYHRAITVYDELMKELTDAEKELLQWSQSSR